MKKNNKKGFTLMEMLIVVAIIAILVAIAIPTFTGSLDKARQAADEANIRAAYADAMSKYLVNPDAAASATTSAMQSSGSATIAGKTISWSKDDEVEVTVSTTGEVKIGDVVVASGGTTTGTGGSGQGGSGQDQGGGGQS